MGRNGGDVALDATSPPLPLLPAGTILEIAPGFGRWTQYLKDLCDELVIVDLSERCIDACRERFAGESNIEYHVNDGRSVDMIGSGTVDLAFSFDSLVHVDTDTLGSYLAGFARVLSPDGVAVIHHSNMGTYRRSASLTRRIPVLRGRDSCRAARFRTRTGGGMRV